MRIIGLLFFFHFLSDVLSAGKDREKKTEWVLMVSTWRDGWTAVSK